MRDAEGAKPCYSVNGFVGHTHLSRVENEHLNYGEYPSDDLIHRIAEALEASEDELRILAKRVPESVKRRVIERPDAFLAFAACDNAQLDKLLVEIGKVQKKSGK